jgi:RNA polymerase sigma-54 factor
VGDHLPALAKRDTQALCAALGATLGMVEAACDVIRDLEPRPGSRIAPPSTDFVIPDAHVFRRHGKWEVKLSAQCQPRLSINHTYASLKQRRGSEEATYIRARHQEAQWLIRALETRAETIHKVACAILRNQHAFFEKGPEALRPLTLSQVAAEVGLHESTISRVTTRKFLAAPRGTFEFKYFFSSSLNTDDGQNASSTAIQAMIRKLVDAEHSQAPLTDIALSQAFQQRGIRVARRTISKYRELLRIPPSIERVRRA